MSAIQARQSDTVEISAEMRDFASVGRTARWMMQLKGYTTLPYAREVAGMLAFPESFIPDFSRRDFSFWASTLGLESRYRSVDQLLEQLPCPNVLELASGYSFRGLDFATRKKVFYADTDLPAVLADKMNMYEKLKPPVSSLQGSLQFRVLNVLDEEAFAEIASAFPAGEIAIVNEGLLSYLTLGEKERLCKSIHRILTERGGRWITADILPRGNQSSIGLKQNQEVKEFLEERQTEANSFGSFRQAEEFFNRMGFVVEKEAAIRHRELSSFRYLVKSMSLRHFLRIKKTGKMQATWQLKAI